MSYTTRCIWRGCREFWADAEGAIVLCLLDRSFLFLCGYSKEDATQGSFLFGFSDRKRRERLI
jgi:hypothetical protein